jgi:hypothetical protein
VVGLARSWRISPDRSNATLSNLVPSTSANYSARCVLGSPLKFSACSSPFFLTRSRKYPEVITGNGSVPPTAPAKLTGSLCVVGNNPIPNCTNFSASDQNNAATFVQTVPPSGAGTTSGMLGYMFWGGGCQGNGTVCTYPPNTCQAGVGVGASTFNIPTPGNALRQN